MNDRIIVKNLIVPCRIGLTSEERERRQRVIVDLELFLDLNEAGKTDKLEKTLDYRKVLESVKSNAADNDCKLLEHLAERIASHLLENPVVQRVDVKLTKLKYSKSPIISVA